jgi:membrane fusion protein, copper/silver efflux system
MKAISILMLIVLLFGCKNKKKENAVSEIVYYTCSMHPQIIRPGPGKCPICHMELVPMMHGTSTDDDDILLTDRQIKLANISVDTIRNGMLGNQLILTATLNFDQSGISIISSRIMGRVEKLYYKNLGDQVKKGDKLYDIYSEDLNNAKKEYILAIEKRSKLDNSIIDFERIIRSAKNKLLLWGLTESDIQKLPASKGDQLTTSIYSNASGYITSLDIKEGDYIMEGGAVMRIADLSTIWVEAQVYNSELTAIGDSVIAEVRTGGETVEGTIEFINAEVSTDSRITLIRIVIPNINSKLKPGMPAHVTIKKREHNMLSLPVNAVLRDSKGATVWIMTSNYTFKNKMVEIGMETGDRIEIRSGLKEGDIVVVTGAYLLNSEYVFKNGADPMAGMKM